MRKPAIKICVIKKKIKSRVCSNIGVRSKMANNSKNNNNNNTYLHKNVMIVWYTCILLLNYIRRTTRDRGDELL